MSETNILDTLVRYEYSEEQGCFHCNYGDYEPESNGYRTLCESISLREISRFGNKSLIGKDKKTGRTKTFDEIKALFDAKFPQYAK